MGVIRARRAVSEGDQQVTKAEVRKARRAAHAAGSALVGELALDRDTGREEYTETARGRRALDRWARRYDDLNGAPESEDDR